MTTSRRDVINDIQIQNCLIGWDVVFFCVVLLGIHHVVDTLETTTTEMSLLIIRIDVCLHLHDKSKFYHDKCKV